MVLIGKHLTRQCSFWMFGFQIACFDTNVLVFVSHINDLISVYNSFCISKLIVSVSFDIVAKNLVNTCVKLMQCMSI